MRTTIDKAGRVVIPKKIRDAAGLQPGMTLDVQCRDGRIEIEPHAAPIRLVRRGLFLVAVLDEPGEPLTTEMVEEIRESIQWERFPYIE